MDNYQYDNNGCNVIMPVMHVMAILAPMAKMSLITISTVMAAATSIFLGSMLPQYMALSVRFV